MRPHSFDRSRERPAPTSFTARTLDGRVRHVVLTRLTLVVAIKTSCDGCRDVVEAPGDAFSGVEVLLISREPDSSGEWSGACREVLVAPALFDELDVRSAPFYVVIDPARGRVVREGVLFAPAQVAAEIADLIRPEDVTS